MNTRLKLQAEQVVASAIHDTGLVTARLIAGEAYSVADIAMFAYAGRDEEADLDVSHYAGFSLDEDSARFIAWRNGQTWPFDLRGKFEGT